MTTSTPLFDQLQREAVLRGAKEINPEPLLGSNPRRMYNSSATRKLLSFDNGKGTNHEPFEEGN